MFHGVVGVEAGTCDAPAGINDDRTDAGTWRGQADALTRHIESAVQKLLVTGVVGHEVTFTTETLSHGGIQANTAKDYRWRGGKASDGLSSSGSSSAIAPDLPFGLISTWHGNKRKRFLSRIGRCFRAKKYAQ